MSRSISVALTPSGLAPECELHQACSIIIDVLRATSVMTTAGLAGAKRMITCENIHAAFEIADQSDSERADQPPSRPLLCGERHCKPIDGFDLGNSPAEYTPDRVVGRDIVLTTTNGTRAIQAAMRSRRLLAASFLNLAATVAAVESEPHLQIVCAGTNGQISYEDVLLAGAIIDRLNESGSGPGEPTDHLDDSARIAWSAWRQSLTPARALEESLALSLGGRNLIEAGYTSDIGRCAQIDTIDGIAERVDPGKAVFRFVKR
ncbi:putative 2-phosphosulfolactate phosphatase [Stieleria maiorica]|uniref:Probable 2-phosphosulfolactate phosphatase n=1 Tax=Stieleria maiorica TaxID=2795974 RepID=A0A5B9MQB5_9BACT|nr:2-phosphosulfolactate phosphatase [Stieleria maiorica]QEG01158.1 putative 2-phosphosulfolactate phosphatase [Stieleria maiorica]